jgi:diguanylate cyclase (GGDEF)-like protein
VDIIHFLSRAGVRAVGYDILFSGRRKNAPEQDKALVETFRDTKNLYFSFNLDNNLFINRQLGKEISASLKKLLLDQALPLKNRLNPIYEQGLALDSTGFFENDAMTFNNIRGILPEFFDVRDRLGVINHGRDADGVSRGNPLFYRLVSEDASGSAALSQASRTGGTQVAVSYYPYLPFKMCLDLCPDVARAMPKGARRPWSQHPDFWIHVKSGGMLAFPGYRIPLAENGNFLVNWFPDNIHPYPEIPVWQILRTLRNEARGVQTLEDMRLKQFFAGKVVFVGASAVSTFDIKTTPVSRLMPGVMLLATIFDNLYQNKIYIHRASDFLNTLLTGLLCLLSSLMIIYNRSALAGIMGALGLLLIYLIGSVYVFKANGLWVGVALPCLSLIGMTTLTYVVKYISRDKDFEKMLKLATTDGLTGLHNHRYFQETMLSWTQRVKKSGGSFSLLLVDIDFFKKFNDTYGHQAGDAVLRQVAMRLRNGVRQNDVVCRYGGEEMALILNNTADEEALRVANTLVERIARSPFRLAEGLEVNVTISVGVATCAQHGAEPAVLIEFADQCLYRAKHAGRNQVGPREDDPAAQALETAHPAPAGH